MTAQGIAGQSRRQAAGWRGRASDHRREQVRARALVPLPATSPGPTGPAGPAGPRAAPVRSIATTLPSIDAQWASLVDVLNSMDAPAYALLSTESGFPLKAHGYGVGDLVTAVRAANRTFEARRADVVVEHDVATLELDSGTTQTVIAAISSSHGTHLLSVTADGVSMPVLRAWTHHTATKFGALLDQP